MSLNVIFQQMTTELINKGKTPYEKGVITYSYNGRNQTQGMVSFTNPAIFKMLKGLAANTPLAVEVTKNEAGYNQWVDVKVFDSEEGNSTPTPEAASGKTNKFGEAEARRQAYIIRQSSLGHAVSSLVPGSKGPLERDTVLARAQEYVDWVFAQDTVFPVANTE